MIKFRVVLASLALLAVSSHATAEEKLTLLLDWFINPDHAPLIVAQENGWFAEAGLEVELVEPADPSLPPKLVAAGKADVAISYQPQLHMQVDTGLPVVRFATLVASPLNSLVVLQDGAISSVADLKGKKIGYSVGGFEDALLGSMLETYDISLDEVELVNVNWSLSPSLISGKVDAVIGAFRNFELNQMDIEGKPGRAFYPEEHGVPVYDELIMLANKDSMNSEKLQILVDVVERATQYIINHPDQALEEFIASNKELLDNELNRRAWYDTLPRFALRPGALDESRYQRFAAFMHERGLIKTPPALQDYAVELGG
jgi:putative hydroxymethylpyrimidine transport system substrate-binding protein